MVLSSNQILALSLSANQRASFSIWVKMVLGIDTTLSNESLFVLTPKMQNFFDVRNITVPSNNSDAFSFVTRYLTESEINPMMKYTVDEAQNMNLVYDTFCEDEASVSTQVEVPERLFRLDYFWIDFAPKFKLTQRIKTV